jgi:hypothetical protein
MEQGQPITPNTMNLDEYPNGFFSADDATILNYAYVRYCAPDERMNIVSAITKLSWNYKGRKAAMNDFHTMIDSICGHSDYTAFQSYRWHGRYLLVRLIVKITECKTLEEAHTLQPNHRITNSLLTNEEFVCLKASVNTDPKKRS